VASAVFQKFTYRNVACATRFNFKKTLLAGLPLFLGGLIYLLFRPGSLRIFMWLDFAGLREPLELLRVHTLQLVPLMPEWFNLFFAKRPLGFLLCFYHHRYLVEAVRPFKADLAIIPTGSRAGV